MKKTVLSLCLLVTGILLLSAESDAVYKSRISQKMADVEMFGGLALWFTDAETGEAVEGADFSIEGYGRCTTDKDGLAVFPRTLDDGTELSDGDHQFTIQKDGYMTVTDTFTIFGGSIYQHKFSLPRSVQEKSVKIILDWGSAPRDLDAHLVKENGWHVSAADSHRSTDGAARLERDDKFSYGPETITLSTIDTSSVYHFYVQDNSDADYPSALKLARSGAVVRIYIDNKLVYIFRIPEQQKGIYWNVFDIKNGTVKPVNNVSVSMRN
jgi:hypothetical protein